MILRFFAFCALVFMASFQAFATDSVAFDYFGEKKIINGALKKQKWETELEHKKRIMAHQHLESIFEMSNGNKSDPYFHSALVHYHTSFVKLDPALDTSLPQFAHIAALLSPPFGSKNPEEEKNLKSYFELAETGFRSAFLAQNLFAKNHVDRAPEEIWEGREKVLLHLLRTADEALDAFFDETPAETKSLTALNTKLKKPFDEKALAPMDDEEEPTFLALRSQWKSKEYTCFYAKSDGYVKGIKPVTHFCNSCLIICQRQSIEPGLIENSEEKICGACLSSVNKQRRTTHVAGKYLSTKRDSFVKDVTLTKNLPHLTEENSFSTDVLRDFYYVKSEGYFEPEKRDFVLTTDKLYLFKPILFKGNSFTIKPISPFSFIESLTITPIESSLPIYLEGAVDFNEETFNNFSILNGTFSAKIKPNARKRESLGGANIFGAILNEEALKELDYYRNVFTFGTEVYQEKILPKKPLITRIYRLADGGKVTINPKEGVRMQFRGGLLNVPLSLSGKTSEEECIRQLSRIAQIVKIERF